MLLLSRLLKGLIRVGTLTVVDARGKRHIFAGAPGQAVTIRLHEPALARRLFFNPRFHVGQAYMDGVLTVEDGDLHDFLNLVGANSRFRFGHWLLDGADRALRLLNPILQHNPIGRAQRNVAHHYDLSGTLYDLFLDRDRQYSCAYFTDPGNDLDQAQHDKKAHLAAKLLLKPGQKVLDIGSGWGGLGLYLARAANVDVTGVTLSEEQLKVSQARAAKAGLADHVHFRLQDYRLERNTYDRIVSVGMFEHVGVKHYPEFFGTLSNLLSEDGVALLHTIGRTDGPGTTNGWVRKYIFPGGYCPALSEVLPVIERCGLVVTDIEVLRLHYAMTLRHWYDNFRRNRDKVRAIYDERFCRMWEFYLASAEMSFRHQGMVNFQIQIARRQDAVPLTRDYIYEWERTQTARAVSAA